MANPGYGKRSAPDQLPVRAATFKHLPAREAYVAGFVDRLPDGAAMDAKTLAKALPLHGQAAVLTALNNLSAAGHLRRVRRRAEPGDTGPTRWVFHTYWSRTARDNEWWAQLVDGDVPGAAAPETRTDTPAEASPEPAPRDTQDAPDAVRPKAEAGPGPSPAYTALVQLGFAEPRLALSAADCAALEGLAADWFARGTDAAHLVRSLASGLPEQVHSPRALVQRRLRDKMPPEPPALPDRPAPTGRPAPRVLMECTDCRVPGRPEALPGGLCRACRNRGAGAGTAPKTSRDVLPADAVRLRADQLRNALREPCRT
ncbi:MarR family transcriptional regulator [Streptomyces sp. GQFP]|uniref:MarR family transcriptional regulator n=1 Tax=Streptomyces sp. GQFP TaxID=2907545 RepID=UPI001F28798F|nr:MarR family transcriptional regulator [Streptomyces sp. GQFP]UIX32545.1 MarR family transcriptional regulator [Streptomyces sp. GQFP]